MPTHQEIAKLVDAFPAPHAKTSVKGERPGVLSDADKPAMEASLAELHAAGHAAYVVLIDMLVAEDPATDSKVRHVIGALAIQAGAWKAEDRQALAEALGSAVGGARPNEIQAFIIRQLQVCGTKDVAPVLGRVLTNAHLAAPAAAALLAIGDGAAEQFRAALPKASGPARLSCLQALGVLKDLASVEALRQAAADPDRDVRCAALWALANQGDAGSVDLLLKAADVSGYERIELTKACLILAENLAAGGNRAEAGKIYAHLRATRTDKSETYVKEIAERAMTRV